MENPIENAIDIIKAMSEASKDKLYLKVNLPDTISGYRSGNGEGCWALPYTEEDKEILDKDEKDTKAKIILCNDSIYYRPLVYGSVLQVEIRPDARPVLDIEWMQEQLAPIGVDFRALLD